MKSYFIFIVFITLVIPIFSISAATLYSNGTNGGDWDDPNSWDGINTPTDIADGDTLVIQLGDTITLSGIITFNGVIQVYGVLVLDNGKLNMDASSVIQFAPGSAINTIGSGQNNTISIGAPSNSISTDEINDLTIPNQLTESSLEAGGCAVTLDCDDNPLPVEVVYFRALEQAGSIKLEWATSFEENFDFFTIERSSDGKTFLDFIKLFSKTEYSSKTKTYAFIDEMPFPGLSYYRLKSTDFDGSIEYHGVVSVNREDDQPDILLYASPMIRDIITISYNGEKESPFKVLNIAGQIIEEGIILPGLNEIQIPQSMSSSIYFFHIEGSNSLIVKKFIIR